MFWRLILGFLAIVAIPFGLAAMLGWLSDREIRSPRMPEIEEFEE